MLLTYEWDKKFAAVVQTRDLLSSEPMRVKLVSFGPWLVDR